MAHLRGLLGALALTVLGSGCSNSEGAGSGAETTPDGGALDGTGGEHSGSSGGTSGGGAANSGGKTSGSGGAANGGKTSAGGTASAGGSSSGGATSSGGAPAGTGGLGADDPGAAPTADCPFTADKDGFFKLTSPKSDYWVRLPPAYDVKAPTPQRLLVGVHGCGDSAQNFASWALVPYDKRAGQSYIAISIGGRDGDCWTMETDNEKVTAAMEHVRSCFYVHKKKVVIAGYSSGGMLAYDVGMKNAASFAGILIENSGLSQGVGGNVATVLANVAWKINVGHTARLGDDNFPIDGVRADRDKMLAAKIPLQYREIAGEHGDTDTDWGGYLLPLMGSWVAP